MKRVMLIVVMLLMFISIGNSQVLTRYYDTYDLFMEPFNMVAKSAIKDSMKVQYNFRDYWGRGQLFYMITSDTTKDSLRTNPISNKYKYADMAITFGIQQDTAHFRNAHEVFTMDVELNMGVFRGFGYGSAGDLVQDSGEIDSLGWHEYNLFSTNVSTRATPDTSLAVSLKDSSWWTDYPVSEWFLEIVEGDTIKCRYFLNVFQFGDE